MLMKKKFSMIISAISGNDFNDIQENLFPTNNDKGFTCGLLEFGHNPSTVNTLISCLIWSLQIIYFWAEFLFKIQARFFFHFSC